MTEIKYVTLGGDTNPGAGQRSTSVSGRDTVSEHEAGAFSRQHLARYRSCNVFLLTAGTEQGCWPRLRPFQTAVTAVGNGVTKRSRKDQYWKKELCYFLHILWLLTRKYKTLQANSGKVINVHAITTLYINNKQWENTVNEMEGSNSFIMAKPNET